MTMPQILNITGYVFLVLAVVFGGLAVYTYKRLDIKSVRDDLSGRARQENIEALGKNVGRQSRWSIVKPLARQENWLGSVQTSKSAKADLNANTKDTPIASTVSRDFIDPLKTNMASLSAEPAKIKNPKKRKKDKGKFPLNKNVQTKNQTTVVSQDSFDDETTSAAAQVMTDGLTDGITERPLRGAPVLNTQRVPAYDNRATLNLADLVVVTNGVDSANKQSGLIIERSVIYTDGDPIILPMTDDDE